MPERTSLPQANQTPTTHAGLVLGSVSGPVRSLYMHIPFCAHKCHYCDFYSLVDPRDRQGAFVERLGRELHALAPLGWGAPLATIFVGGGTPSLLPPSLWDRLLGMLHEAFDLSALEEFSVECNPESVSPEFFSTLGRGGVTRVSMGAQSFNPSHLKTLERRHSPGNAGRALAMARDAGIARQSIDLIFGIPGQTLDDWKHDLDDALALGTEHLSCYNLTYEPGTAMTARLKRGEFTPADEDVEVEMFRVTLEAARGAGLERYEVSNFAKPGAQCRHNLVYWRGGNWLAAGPSASGHINGHRWKNTPRLDDYLSIDRDGFAPVSEHETPDPGRAITERLMTGLRLNEGLDRAWVLTQAATLHAGAASRLAGAIERQTALGFLEADPARLRLTDAGFLVGDSVILELAGALDL
ncbi:MAG: radical SAM family heme chaperone HemW [Phycisphaerales bacterium]|nr:radical SAM family heme chaperone HemW [Phycisphaerales bacterium]